MRQEAKVIDLNLMRMVRNTPHRADILSVPDFHEDRRIRFTRSVTKGRIRTFAKKISEAAQDWGSTTEICSEDDMMRVLPEVIADVGKDQGMQRKTRIARLDRALSERYGDARLARAALLTPQEILDLPGVGAATLDDLIDELSCQQALTVIEIVTGRGKAGTKMAATLPEAFFEIGAGLPGHTALRH